MPYKIVLSTETLNYKNNLFEIKNIHPSNPKCTWTERMAETLKKIDSKYIIFMLDDFFLYDFVKTNEINKCIDYFEKNQKIATFTFYSLFMQSKPSKYGIYNIKEKNSRYKVCALIGIWNKKVLQKYIDGYKENIWEWEKNATERSNVLYPRDEFYVMKNEAEKIFPYDPGQYGLFSGKWLVPTKEKFEELGINMDYSRRGFYNEALRGREKSIIASFEIDSGVIPYYSLTHKKSSYLKCDKKTREGKFKQEYNILGARDIVRWEPSTHWGFAIKGLKICVKYKDKSQEIIESSNLFGGFTKEGNTYIFNKPCSYMLIPTEENKIISKLIIEGEIVFPLSEKLLEETYNKETATNNTKYLERVERLWDEFLVSKEKMYHIDFNPNIFGIYKDGRKRKIESTYKIHKKTFVNKFSIDEEYSGIDWMANKNPGYMIKNIKIFLKMKDGKTKKISKGNIQTVLNKKGNEYYFIGSTILHFDIPCKNIDKITITGKFKCPIESKKLKKIIYNK